MTHLGVLSTKVKTPLSRRSHRPQRRRGRQTTTDYSRLADSEGVFTPTAVTIGYDAPWRQVQSLLLLAAERTPGLRQDAQTAGPPVGARGLLRQVHVARLPRASGVALRSRSTRCTATFRICSTSTASRSCRPNYSSRSGGAEGRGQEGLVCRARDPPDADSESVPQFDTLTCRVAGGWSFNAPAGRRTSSTKSRPTRSTWQRELDTRRLDRIVDQRRERPERVRRETAAQIVLRPPLLDVADRALVGHAGRNRAARRSRGSSGCRPSAN